MNPHGTGLGITGPGSEPSAGGLSDRSPPPNAIRCWRHRLRWYHRRARGKAAHPGTNDSAVARIDAARIGQSNPLGSLPALRFWGDLAAVRVAPNRRFVVRFCSCAS